MIPILFSPTTTDFSTNGIGRLSDAISCKVHEARNGEFELEMQYPMTGKHFESIVHSAIIAAKPSARRQLQAFRIYKISKPLNGRVTINAQHISYQLSFIPVSPFSAASLTNALNGFRTNAAENCPFTLSADFTSASSYAVPLPVSIRSYLGGTEGSILDVYGGEWEWNNYSCILHRSRGQDNGYVIQYGKNLTELRQEESIAETYTGLYPYWESDETMVTLPEKVVHAATAANFPFQRTIVHDFSDKFDNAPTETQLRSLANAYMTANNIGVPAVNLSLDFINLADSEEYKDILTTGNIDLCDTVTVRFSRLGVDVKSKVIDITWNVLKDRYDQIQIGDKRNSLADTIEDQLEQITTLATSEDVARTVDRATGVLNAGRRGHVIINRNADGFANEILFLDNENLAAARNVLRINMNGIGFSSSGYQGPYYQAWTLDGVLSLGGVNNAYGDLQILDPSGKLICRVDKDGYKIYDTNGSTIIGQWSHAGISLNKGVINFNWGSNQIGVYADGTKFQAGDWVVSNVNGRDVLQSSDEVTGMSSSTDNDKQLYLWAGWESDSDYVFCVNGGDAYVMYNGQAYPIGESLSNLNNAVNVSGGGNSGPDIDDEEDAAVVGGLIYEDGWVISPGV